MDNNVETILLTDENGKETEFRVIVKLDIKENEYVIVTPNNKDVDEAIALKIVENEDGEDALITVDDEDEFATVAEAYETLFSEDKDDIGSN